MTGHFTPEAIAASADAVESIRTVIDGHPDLDELFDLGVVRVDDRRIRVLVGGFVGDVPMAWLVVEGEEITPFALPALTLSRLRQKLDRAANHIHHL